MCVALFRIGRCSFSRGAVQKRLVAVVAVRAEDARIRVERVIIHGEPRWVLKKGRCQRGESERKREKEQDGKRGEVPGR